MNAKTSIGRRVAAAVGALAVGIAGLALSATAANALSASDIDTSKTGSVTVHKYAGNPSATQNKAGSRDGRQLSDSDAAALGQKLAGVGFTIQEVTYNNATIDLGTPEGWTQVQTAQAGFQNGKLPAGFQTWGPATTKTTDDNGDLTFDNLPVRLYVVTETTPGSNNIVTKAAPFLVTVPYPSRGNIASSNGTNKDDTWIYDVHTYPKNEIAGKPVKSVTDPGRGLAIGQNVQWTVKQPLVDNGKQYNKVNVYDTFDSTLGVDQSNVVGGVYLGNDTNGVKLDPTTDYTVAVEGQKATVALTASGLAKVNVKPLPANVIVVFNTKVNSLKNATPDANGHVTIPNTANGVTNNGGGDVDQPTNTVGVNYGSIRVVKKSQEKGNTLKGAQFQLCKVRNDDFQTPSANEQKVKADYDKSSADCSGSATYTSDDNGQVNIDGIWTGYTDATHDQYSRDYVLKEIKAPAGYVLPDDPYTVINVNRNNIADAAVKVDIKNQQTTGPDLPLTGAAGTALLVGMGALLVIGGGASAAVARKRRAEANR